MQLVQPSKFFSVTIFRTRFHRQYWDARVRTWAMLLFLVTLKNFDVCTVTMGVAKFLIQNPHQKGAHARILVAIFGQPTGKSLYCGFMKSCKKIQRQF